MRSTGRWLAAVIGIVACGASETSGPALHAAIADTTLPAARSVPRFQIDTVVRGLSVPWGLAWTPDGRMLMTERSGRISILRADSSMTTWATLDVFGDAPGIGPESGLMGIAVAPDFERTGHVFVVATTWRSRGDRDGSLLTRLWRRTAQVVSPAEGLRLRNSVIRFTDRDGVGTDSVTIYTAPTSHYHAGGGIAFGPDGMLYVSVGDALSPRLAPVRSAPVGKLLRLTPSGAIPADNPTSGSPTWAAGLRNTQAFGWLPNGTLIGVDHGPSGMPQEGGRAGLDEMNVLRAGEDYGWPRDAGKWFSPGKTPPIFVWESAIAPAGLVILASADTAPHARLLVAGLRGQLELLDLESRGEQLVPLARSVLIDKQFGRLRTLARGPDGAIFLTTSNRDARGVARPGDDLLLRLRLQD